MGTVYKPMYHFTWVSSSGIAGSQSGSNCISNCQTVLQSSCPSPHSASKEGVFGCSSASEHLGLSLLLVSAGLAGGKQCLIVAFLHISLMTNDGMHFLTYLLAVSVSFMECLFIFTHFFFLITLSVFSVLICWCFKINSGNSPFVRDRYWEYFLPVYVLLIRFFFF